MVQTEQPLLTLVSCLIGSVSSNYSPPLTTTPQNVNITGTAVYSNCLGGGVTSASNSTNALATDYSCLGLLEIGTAPSVLTWNTGETSTLVQTRVAVQGAGLSVTVTHFGSVSSGKFAGATTVRVTEFLNTDLDACYTSGGLARLSGPSTLTVLGLL
ncbi:hypothetical protein MFU01_09040 [Myxococcus fulvus]|uniref:Uncharacterized protein n=1 Tax=Myxococcus fulvus TaxID=33 RepID=A0A511SWE4_MYXFU|nr:hypothetical protein MFU01_09040 [Myxococcus fulvus]